MKHQRFLLLTCVAAALASSIMVSAQESIDLSGKWEFQIDRHDEGVAQKWHSKTLDDSITLPASMPEMLKGDLITAATEWTGSIYDSTYYVNPAFEIYRKEGNVKFPFFLTPERQYKGAAWYKRSVQIPAEWKGEYVELYLERPHIETTLWLDGKQVGVQNSLNTAHIYDITPYVKPGKTLNIAIIVDNRIKLAYRVGPDSHSITDQTQGNWNGIVGKIELRHSPRTRISEIQVYPDLKSKTAQLRLTIESPKNAKADLKFNARSYNNPTRSHQAAHEQKGVSLKAGKHEYSFTLPMGDGMLTWDEFSPTLYNLSAELTSTSGIDKKSTRFGMREISIEGKYFYINGRQVFMRGTVENCCFPYTGYPPTDLESWLRIFRICRNYGLNHMRYHSYCPPAAAFEAADIVGFYLQPEGPAWPNHGGVGLGNGDPVDTYLLEETKRMVRDYGNSPSFCLMAAGNEPAGRYQKWVGDFVDYWSETDPRRIYTGTSGWSGMAKDQYSVTMIARGLPWKQSRPETMTNYGANVNFMRVPILSHETGQWCAFPNFDEIRKYTGVNKALNFEIFRDFLDKNGMSGKGHDFHMASGKLQALCYKYELERHLRTPNYAGFQLLCINDYSGQGSALTGVTDVFFEPKEYISAEQWRRFCNTTVPLLKLEKFVFANDEKLSAELEVAHYGAEALKNAEFTYTIRNEYRVVLASGVVARKDISIGTPIPVGKFEFDLSSIDKAGKFNVEVAISGTDFINDWDFWVYPRELPIDKGDVYVTDTLDNNAVKMLSEGGKVLLLAAGKVKYGSDIKQNFQPVFWNTSWFKMKAPHTTGLWLNDHHKIFAKFPTEYHSNIQWWELTNNAQVMQLTDFPKDFQPLIHSIDTWFLSRKAGMLFEANVLGGRLVMTTMDLDSDPDNRLAARQMYASILEYMNGDFFRPSHKIDIKLVQDLFTKTSYAMDFGTVNVPDELKADFNPLGKNK